MSDKSLSEDFLAEKMEVLEGWPPEEWDDAQDLSDALTEPQREAVWALYDRVEDLMLKVMRRQIQSTDEVDPDKLKTVLPIAFLRTLARYDHEQSHLTTYIWHEARQQIRREIRAVTGQAGYQRRIERALSQLFVITKQQEEREPTLQEKVEYVRDHVYYARQISREALVDTIAEIEEQTGETPSLDANYAEEGDEDGDGSLADVLPSDSPETVDIGEVGRIIAEETDRIELWERLQDEEPTTKSFSNAKARTILLELRARGADPQQVAWEHQTSPFVVSAIEDLYDVELTDDEVERYRQAQGYDKAEPDFAHGRALTDEEALELRERYEQEDVTYAELADEHKKYISGNLVGDAVRGEGAYSRLDDEQQQQQDDSQGPALTDDEVEEVRERYQDEDVTQAELAEDYDVSKHPIRAALRGDGAYDHLNEIEKIGPGRGLTDEEALEVRERYEHEDITQSELAEEYPVSYSTINAAIRGDGAYDHLDETDTSPDTTLTAEEVEQVREEYHKGADYSELVEKWEPAQTTIARMIRGEAPYDNYDSIAREGGHDRALTDEEALEVRRRYEDEDVYQRELAEEYEVERSVITNAINGRRAYSHLSDNDHDTDSVTKSEDSDMKTKEALEAQVGRLTTIIERAAKDLSRSDAEEIREHFDELGLTREQLQGVHDVAAIDVERALMGEGYDDFDDLTTQSRS